MAVLIKRIIRQKILCTGDNKPIASILLNPLIKFIIKINKIKKFFLTRKYHKVYTY